MFWKWSAFVLLLLAVPTLALAQSTGKLAGRVVDAETGEPLPGANVVVEGTQLGTATNVDGEYTILDVPPGNHPIVASFIGYATERREDVQVIAGITNRVNFDLQPTAIEGQVIEVVADRPLVNPTATNAVRRLGREEFAKLPTRNVETFYAIQPGVTLLNDEIYIRGGRPDETNFLLEGISSRSLLGADNVVPVIPEALEEVQVLAGGYSAELGGANAGIVQQVLRTGGSTLSGMVQYETDRLADVAGFDYVNDYSDYTVTLGGPLGWDRLRFFTALNYQDTDNYDPLFWYGADLGMPVDDVTGDTATAALAWGDAVLPGIGRPQEQFLANGTLSLDLSPLRLRLGFAQVNRDRRINDYPIFNFFNQERLPQRDDLRRLVNLEASYLFGGNTIIDASVGLFQYDFEIYDPLFDRPTADGAGGAALDLVDYYSRDAVEDAFGGNEELAKLYTRFWREAYQQPNNFQFNGFRFNRPGANATTWYQKREQSYYNLGLDLTSQQENHQLDVGAHYQRWTVRDFAFNGRGLAQQIQFDSTFVNEIENETPTVAATIRRTGSGGFGFDEFMNEVDDGPDAAKHPVTASVYVNDKIEYQDIIVNAGLRYDYFDMDLFEPDSTRAVPGFNSADFTVEGLRKAPGKGVLQPRLGLSFPVTDRTVFHLQYGKFAQMPDMSYVYASRAEMAVSFGGQNFISNPFAFDLDPIRSTQYEIGFAHQFTDFASFDLTAFYRKTQGQLEIILQETSPEAEAADYNLYDNGDFAIARGLEFVLRTRRFGNFMGMFNYTLTDAKGTNAEPGGQVAALENGTAPPSLIQPLFFEERHRGAIILDYRTGPGGTLFAQDWAANLLLTFHSGHRFTRSTGGLGQRGADEGALLTDRDPRNRIPLEPLGSSTTPWFFNLDLRLEKAFDLGGVTAAPYFYAQNLLNARNVINVYLRTGNADSDGFLSDPELSEQIVAGRGPEYVRYYEAINLRNRQHYMDPLSGEGDDLFADPRSVRLGFRLEF